jgi:hypothetical protein
MAWRLIFRVPRNSGLFNVRLSGPKHVEKLDNNCIDAPCSFKVSVFMARQRWGLLVFEASRSHSKDTPHSSERVIGPTQRPLHDNTQHSQQTDIHAPRRDSNPQSQQAGGRTPTPYTVRPLRSAINYAYCLLTPKFYLNYI